MRRGDRLDEGACAACPGEVGGGPRLDRPARRQARAPGHALPREERPAAPPRPAGNRRRTPDARRTADRQDEAICSQTDERRGGRAPARADRPRLLRLPRRRLGRGQHRLPSPPVRLRAHRTPVMGLFRRESLHERLAREGGGAEPSGVPPAWDATGIHGVARAREWGLVPTLAAPGIEGDAGGFVALPAGSLFVAQEQGEGSLEPLATAVEQKLQPPYRARGARQTDVLWAVSAGRVETASVEGEGGRGELTETAGG